MTKANYFPANFLRQYFEIREGELWRFGYTDTKGRKYPDKKVKLKANTTEGYCHVKCKGRMLQYHRLVWILVNGDIPAGKEMDHINGNRLDNRLENLRLVTSRENNQNRSLHRATGMCGYRWHKRDKKWHARIYINGKHIHLGAFSNENEAQKAYNIACELIEVYENKEQFRELVKSRITKQERILVRCQQHEYFQGIPEKTNTDITCRLSSIQTGNDLRS